MAPKKAKPTKKSNRTKLASAEFKEGSYKSVISVETTGDKGNEGIRIRSERQLNSTYARPHRPGAWIPRGIDSSKWLVWFITKFRDLARRFWQKDVDVTPAQVEAYKQQLEHLTHELTKTKALKDEAEQKLQQQEAQLLLANELADNFAAYEKAYEDFKSKVAEGVKTNSRNEAEVKKLISEHKWLLGIDCEVRAQEKQIDTQAEIDLHVTTEQGREKIFEFKSPNLKPFERKKAGARLNCTDHFTEGLNQLITYLRKLDVYSSAGEEGTYKVQRPLGTLVLGKDLDTEQTKLLKEWAFHLRPHIHLMTYDDLISSAKRQLDNIRFARERKNEENK